MLQHRKTINHRDKRFAYVFPTLSKKSKTKFLKDPRKTHNRIIKLAGLEYKCIHFLRHSWATNSYAATGDSLGVQELGGWKDHKSVEKYIKVYPEVYVHVYLFICMYVHVEASVEFKYLLLTA